MSGEDGLALPQSGDLMLFDRPPEGGVGRAFRVAEYDAGTGLTTFAEVGRVPTQIGPLSAQEIAALGGRKVDVLPPGAVVPDWIGPGRKLARDGAGSRPKIHQLAESQFGGLRMAAVDEQAALALAQRAADQTGERWLLARSGSGELIIGTEDALAEAGEGLGAQVLLAVEPGSSGSITARQARDLLARAVEEAATALASMPGGSALDASTAVEAVLAAIADLFPAPEQTWLEEQTRRSWPGWQYHPELMPEVANTLARLQLGPDYQP